MSNFSKAPRDIFLCFSLLTRIPINLPQNAFERQSRATWAFPLVGLGVGLLLWAVIDLLNIGLPLYIAVIVGMATSLFVTGAMHEDGLADCVDGFWGAYTKDRRLEIMKDSQIGTYGVLGLGFVVTLKAIFLIEGAAQLSMILAAAVASRSALPMIMSQVQNARRSGLSQSVGLPSFMTAIGSIFLGCVLVLLLTGLTGILVILFTACLVCGIVMLAKRKIGGQTGDVLGACQIITELGVLALLSLF